jgi:hypothetical protein
MGLAKIISAARWTITGAVLGTTLACTMVNYDTGPGQDAREAMYSSDKRIYAMNVGEILPYFVGAGVVPGMYADYLRRKRERDDVE